MGQGHINQYQPNPHTPVEGIMNALRAVHEYYGIDTTKAQTKLAESQQKNADLESQSKEIELNSEKSAAEGHPDALWYSKHGYTPTGKVSLPGSFGTPQNNASPEGNSVTPASNGLPTSKPLASNNSVGQDLGPSVLAQLVSQKPDFAKNVVAVTANADGTGTTWGLDPKKQKDQVDLENAVTEGKLKNQNLAKGDYEAKHAGDNLYKGTIEAFDKDAAPIKSAINEVSGAQKGLLSGSPSAEKLAQVKNVMSQLGIKRITSGTAEVGSPEAALTQIENALNTKTTGHMSPSQIHEINEGINTFLENQHEQLAQLTELHAQRAANTVGGSAEQIASKYLLPGYKAPKLVDTRIVQDGDQNVLQKMDRGSANQSDSKAWKTIDTGQNTKSVSGNGKMGRLERNVIGGVAIGGGLVSHVLGKISHLLGAGAE